jgi:hypothetical protein
MKYWGAYAGFWIHHEASVSCTPISSGRTSISRGYYLMAIHEDLTRIGHIFCELVEGEIFREEGRISGS